MEIWEIDKLLLFIVFVIPGFVSIKCYQLLFPGTEKSASDQIVDAIAYSSINYALLSLPIIGLEKINNNFLNYLFYFFALFVAPIIWVFFWKYLRTRHFFQKNAPHPMAKPWDYVFSQRKPYWVKITLKDGVVIAGKYAENSFTSSSPASEQIYLEERWLLSDNGGFERKINDTAGVIILSSEILYVELRNYEG